MPQEIDAQFMKTMRYDLAALCCAGAFVAQPDMWATFVEWVKGIDSQARECDFSAEQATHMMHSVLRMDRLIMLSHLLSGPENLEIGDLLDGEL